MSDNALTPTNMGSMPQHYAPGDCSLPNSKSKTASLTKDSTASLITGGRGGPPEVHKKALTKSSCFQRGSNIECLHSHDDIMPQRPARRVRALGREITDRANTCSWYQHMVEPEFSPVKKTTKDTPPEEGADMKVLNGEIGEEDLDEDSNAILKEQQKQNNALTLTNVSSEQLLTSIDSKNELTDDIDKSSVCTRSSITSRSSKSGTHQRRLRGDVAKLCAKRNEGSIKSLIWNNEGVPDDEHTVITNQSDIKSISSNSSMDTLHKSCERLTTPGTGKINNSSSAIQALISNSFCNRLN